MKFAIIVIVALLTLSVYAELKNEKEIISFPFSYAKLRDEGKTVTFHPADLPCSYSFVATINTTVYVPDGNKTEDVESSTVYYDGGMIYYSVWKQSNEVTLTSARRDLANCDTIPVFTVNYNLTSMESSCHSSVQSEADVESTYKSLYPYLFSEQEFSNEIDIGCDSKQCKLYLAETENGGVAASYAVLADESSRVLVYWVKMNYSVAVSEVTVSLTYADDFDLSVFAFNKTTFPSCEEEAYSDPEEQCTYDSGVSPIACSPSSFPSSTFDSSSSSPSSTSNSSGQPSPSLATTCQAAITLVIAAIATAFVALF